jgi:hypothetical protein
VHEVGYRPEGQVDPVLRADQANPAAQVAAVRPQAGPGGAADRPGQRWAVTDHDDAGIVGAATLTCNPAQGFVDDQNSVSRTHAASLEQQQRPVDGSALAAGACLVKLR